MTTATTTLAEAQIRQLMDGFSAAGHSGAI